MAAYRFQKNWFMGFTALAIGLFLGSTAFAADTYVVDGIHSYVGFSVKHLGLSQVQGHFTDFGGSIVWDSKNLVKSNFSGTVNATTVTTGQPMRDKHLKSPDFFGTDQFPEFAFKSSLVEKTKDGYLISGDLTIRGVKKPVKIPVKIVGPITEMQGRVRIGISGQFTINRQDWGVSWNRLLDNGGFVVDNMVTIVLEVEGVKQ